MTRWVLVVLIGYLSLCCDKNGLRRGGFILAHSSSEISLLHHGREIMQPSKSCRWLVTLCPQLASRKQSMLLFNLFSPSYLV